MFGKLPFSQLLARLAALVDAVALDERQATTSKHCTTQKNLLEITVAGLKSCRWFWEERWGVILYIHTPFPTPLPPKTHTQVHRNILSFALCLVVVQQNPSPENVNACSCSGLKVERFGEIYGFTRGHWWQTNYNPAPQPPTTTPPKKRCVGSSKDIIARGSSVRLWVLKKQPFILYGPT